MKNKKLKSAVSLLAFLFVASAANATIITGNLLNDAGFESTSSQGGQTSWPVSSNGSWGVGDAFSIVGSENGINPLAGSKMLRFGNDSSSTDIYQIIDVSSYATEIDAGLVSANFSAYYNSFNSPDGYVGLRIVGWSAEPENFSGIDLLEGNYWDALLTDNDQSTWQQVSDSALLTNGLRYLAIGIHAQDDQNQAPRTYVDQTSLTLSIAEVPEPASLALFGLGLLGLRLRKRIVI